VSGKTPQNPKTPKPQNPNDKFSNLIKEDVPQAIKKQPK